MARRLDNWLERFVEYASDFNAPARYCRWAGLWAISAAAKRSIAMKSRGTILAPNLFALLIGGPSTGKSRAVSAASSVLLPATHFSLIPPSVTRAGLEDYMVGNLKMRKAPDGRQIASNECIGLSEEMQGILPDQDLGHLTLYNLLYDLPTVHKAVTRSHGEVRLDMPYCCILTGAQPAFLSTTLPEQAWGMGFMSRSLMIWDTPPPRKSVFDSKDINFKLQADLIFDLKEIFNTNGWIQWDDDAQALYTEWWVNAGGNPIPKHKRLAMGYNGRRELQMLKLSMIYSLAENSDLIVRKQHAANTIRTLLEAENQMQHIFNEMSNTGAMVALEDIIDVVRQATLENKDTHEAHIIELLMQRFPSTQVHSLIENLITSKTLAIAGGSAVRGMRKFKLGERATLGL